MKKLHAVFYALIFFSYSINAQPVFKNLVMEGGGIRGIAYIGAMEILDSAGMLDSIERVGGTSAGAIQACLLAVGYTPAEIRTLLEETSFKKFNDGSFLGVPGALRLSKKMGWYKGEALLQWLEDRIAAKTNNPNITFQQLYEQRKKYGGMALYTTGTDLSWQKLRVFSHETYPNMRIADAVRISSNIPFYFQPIWIDQEGRCFETNDSLSTRSLLVDGGVLSNYPLSLFDSSNYIQKQSLNQFVYNPETLGLQLEEPWLVDSPETRRTRAFPIDDNGSYLKAIYKLLVDKPVYDANRTILISNLALSPRIRKLPKHDVEMLLASGREAARKFLHTSPQHAKAP
ncbi:MAG TPA: patatin-like phospholipase family protein [Phnomibacter sp.]|nr:patatin-like phospholipase family protein [Phnomibacter sp.]